MPIYKYYEKLTQDIRDDIDVKHSNLFLIKV